MKHSVFVVVLLTTCLFATACGDRVARSTESGGATPTTSVAPETTEPIADDVVDVEADPIASTTTGAAATTTVPATTAAPPTTVPATTTAPPTTTSPPSIDTAAVEAANDALAAAEALLGGLESDRDAIAGDLAADAQASASTD